MINANGIYYDKATSKWLVYYGGEWLYTADSEEEAEYMLSVAYSTEAEDY